MGTGKTTIAKRLAETKGWTLISSDQVRKELAGISAAQHEYVAWGKGIYSNEFNQKTYNRMNQLAEKLLRDGKSVILDASYGKKPHRAAANALAKATNAQFTCLEVICSEEEIKRRLTARLRRKGAISDGRWELFIDQKAGFEKMDDFTKEEHIILNTSRTKDQSIKQLMHEMQLRSAARQ